MILFSHEVSSYIILPSLIYSNTHNWGFWCQLICVDLERNLLEPHALCGLLLKCIWKRKHVFPLQCFSIRIPVLISCLTPFKTLIKMKSKEFNILTRSLLAVTFLSSVFQKKSSVVLTCNESGNELLTSRNVNCKAHYPNIIATTAKLCLWICFDDQRR